MPHLTSRLHTLAYLTTALLLATGCGKSGHGAADPLSTGFLPSGDQGSASLGDQIWTNAGVSEMAMGIYTLELDPESLTASVHPRELRSGMANDDLYLLPIDSFLNPASFVLTSVTGTADTVDIEYTVTHPFPAPNNVTGTPNGSTNRADLGVSGMVLFLAKLSTATGSTYFANRAANTTLLANADAYYAPGGLLTTPGVANTFPYRQLVDETIGGTGSRVGVSNGGNVTGNFGGDGWTRAEFGPGNKGWTGYGVLHQGQSSTNVVSLNKSGLGLGFNLDFAIIAKYNDPRGGTTGAEKKANRLPPASPDATKFAYRMPHGALDGARIEFIGESGGFLADTISASTLRVKVVDWDARSAETTAADLSLDPTFKNVANGESGFPLVEVCIPGVLGDFSATAEIDTVVDDDSAYGGDAGVDSGIPTDELFYEALVTKNAGSGQIAGTYTGMIRVTDPEVGLVIGLNESLTPLPTPPTPVTYQVCVVELGGGNTKPTASYTITTPEVASGGPVTIEVGDVVDPDGDPIAVEVDWADDGSFILAGTLISPYAGSTQFTSPINYTFAGPAPDIRNLPVRIDDGSGPVVLTPTATFEVGEPVPPFTTYTVPLPSCLLGFTDVHVATDYDGKPIMVFRDACTDMLMVARCAVTNPDGPEDWPAGSIYPIDAATGKGRYSSIILNFSGLPTVSYYDSTNGNLKVAIGKSRRPLVTNDWNRMTVDSSMNVGTDSALVLLTSGRLGVAYHRPTDGDLRVAFSGRNNPALTADWPANAKYTLVEGNLPLDFAGTFTSAAMVNSKASILTIDRDILGPKLMLRQADPLVLPATFPPANSWNAIEISRSPGGGPPTASMTDLTEANNGFAAYYQSGSTHRALISPDGLPGSSLDLFSGAIGDLSGTQIAAVGECPTMHVVMDNDATGNLTVLRAATFPFGVGEASWASTELTPGGTAVDCGCFSNKLLVVRAVGKNVMASYASAPW